MNFLSIETSTSVCSAALLANEECIKTLIDTSGQNHARLLPLFVSEILDEAKHNNLTIDAIALSQGPGSYTGLRIGTAMAKGLCYGHNIPLLAIDTLQLMAFTARNAINPDNDTILCPMIDARRMEVYTALYDNKLLQLRETTAQIITTDSFADLLEKQKICFFGNGATKCKDIITSDNAIFLDNIVPQASDMGHIALTMYNNKRFADLAYFDPFYLKEFQATVAKNKIF